MFILKFLKSISGFIILGLAWLIATDVLNQIPSSLLPSPKIILTTLSEGLLRGALLENLWATIWRWIPGLAIGVLLGIPLGILLGIFKPLSNIIKGPLEFLRAIPVTALMPLIFLLMNTGEQSKIFMCFLPSFLLLVVYTESGVKHVAKDRVEIFKLMGATKKQTVFNLIIPETIPNSILGLRLAYSTSLLVAIVSEMFMGANSGIGQKIYEAYMYNNTPELYAMIMIIGLLGFLGTGLLEKLEYKVLTKRA